MGPAFSGAGATVTTCSAAEAADAGPADLIVWSALAEHAPPSAVLAGEAEVPDLAAPLIAALANQVRNGTAPDVVALTRDRDAWAGGVQGVIRGLPREWPGASATSLHLDPAAARNAGALALAQWRSADRTSDVRHAARRRAIPSLSYSEPANAWWPTNEQRVLITGGTRGIGLELARRLLATEAHVVLLARSAPGEAAQAVLDAHPGRVVAVQGDVTDPGLDLSGVGPASASSGAASSTSMASSTSTVTSGGSDALGPSLDAGSSAETSDGDVRPSLFVKTSSSEKTFALTPLFSFSARRARSFFATSASD